MKKFLILPILFLVATACNNAGNPQTSSELPSWLQTIIANPRSDAKAIYQNKYKGKIIYELVYGCCDRPTDVYDKNGVLICHRGSAIYGKVEDSRCKDYSEKYDQLIWKKPKKSSGSPTNNKPPVRKKGAPVRYRE